MSYNSCSVPLESVIELAREAGMCTLGHYANRSAVSVAEKSDKSPLTAADLESHACIVARLQQCTPTIPVISEEDEHGMDAAKSLASLWWLVDPLDGTKEFLSGNGQFTVNIALMDRTRPVWGVVHAPALDLTYWGGSGAAGQSPPGTVAKESWRREGARVDRINSGAVAGGAEPAGAERTETAWRIVASRSHMDAGTRRLVEELARLRPTELTQAGSSLKFCRVADGTANLYPRLAPTCEWDTAAAQAVLEGAGGSVSTIRGEPLRYGKSGFRNPFFVADANSTLSPMVADALARIQLQE